MGDVTASVELGHGALRELRARRLRNRLGDIEWFDVAYKVYVSALFGGISLAWLSDLVGDQPLTAAQTGDVAAHGPAVLGVVATLALLLGLRSGSQGGPLALEAADVAHVMLAPVDRRRALTRPAVQRVRSAAFTGAVVAGAFAQLAGRRLPGSTVAWFASGAAFGAAVGLLWVGAAFLAHTWRVPLAVATAIGLVAVTWQVAAVVGPAPGPADTFGSLAMWGWRQRTVDLVAVAVALTAVAVALGRLGRISLEALARRADLVAQLRFAVTMQDLRTVVLLRRQLSHEHTRTRPWLQLAPGGRGHPVWRRGWHSLLRTPTGRLVRMASIAAGAGVCQVLAIRGVTPALVGTALLTFLLGLEVLEPLSQEVDHPDRTDAFPIDRGELMVRHLAAPAVALVPLTIIGTLTGVGVLALLDDAPAWGASLSVGALVGLASVLTGAAGAVVSVVRDAPDPLAGAQRDAFMPPEMAGLTTSLKMLVPIIISAIGATSALFVRLAVDDGASPVGVAVRVLVAAALVVAATTTWVLRRDRVRRWFHRFMAEGRSVTAARRTASSDQRGSL
jgi:hypothetical protein